MFRLDDQFLKDVGLDGLPDDQKQAFLQHVYSELEMKVGTRLSDGLSDAQLEEFEQIIDRKQETVSAWITQHFPNYAQDEVFIKLQKATNLPANDVGLIAEFAATKWLEINRPDYREVVATVLGELKQEILANRDAILGGIQQQSNDAGQSPRTSPQVATQDVQNADQQSSHQNPPMAA